MSKTVSVAQAENQEAVLPARAQEALGELVGAAREGLMALSVGVGLSVVAELMDEEVEDVVGPKGKHDAKRTAVRHGQEQGQVTLGGRRVRVAHPRMRSANGKREIELSTYRHFADHATRARVEGAEGRHAFAISGKVVGAPGVTQVDNALCRGGKYTR